MSRKVIGIHFVCRNSLNVEELGDSRFKSGYWKVSEASARTAEYLALHESRNSLSYKQGMIEKYERCEDRIVFYVKKTQEHREWVGAGTGEKGYFWSDK